MQVITTVGLDIAKASVAGRPSRSAPVPCYQRCEKPLAARMSPKPAGKAAQ
jgi:hypothetical protein